MSKRLKWKEVKKNKKSKKASVAISIFCIIGGILVRRAIAKKLPSAKEDNPSIL